MPQQLTIISSNAKRVHTTAGRQRDERECSEVELVEEDAFVLAPCMYGNFFQYPRHVHLHGRWQ